MIATLISVIAVGAFLAAVLILMAAASRKVTTARYRRAMARFLADKELRQRQDANRLRYNRGDFDTLLAAGLDPFTPEEP